jgi:protein TonB
MFEDSTFDSTRRIRTRSRRWMIAAFAIEAAILLAFILIPLICPEALPRPFAAFLVAAPAPPPAQPLHAQPIAQTAHTPSPTLNDPFAAPSRIPRGILIPASREPEQLAGLASWNPGGVGVPGGTGNPLPVQMTPRVVVHPQAKAAVRVSSAIEKGLLIQETMPVYPAIAKATHTEGTVELAATISKAGNIENLRATSGPPLLQRAALDAVKSWRYRPYLLDGQPVEVETTVDVVFTLGR